LENGKDDIVPIQVSCGLNHFLVLAQKYSPPKPQGKETKKKTGKEKIDEESKKILGEYIFSWGSNTSKQVGSIKSREREFILRKLVENKENSSGKE